MEKINSVITGVGGYVPDYILTNDEISKMVDTNDEWIMTRIGVKERRILNEEGLGTSYMARKAAKQLMQKTASNPDDIDAVIVATTTTDYHFPSTASILCDKLGLKNAFAFDLQAACCGFLYLMETADIITLIGIIITAVLAGANLVTAFFNQRQSQGYNLRMADYERRYVQLTDNVSQYISMLDAHWLSFMALNEEEYEGKDAEIYER